MTTTIPDNFNQEVIQLLKSDYENFWWQILIYMEIVFPHKKDDGSDNEKRYQTIRSKILRLGNDKIRNLDKIFENYIALKMYEYKQVKNENIEAQVFDFSKKWKMNKKGEEENTNE